MLSWVPVDLMGRKCGLVKASFNRETDALSRQKLAIGRKTNERDLVPFAERHQRWVTLVYCGLAPIWSWMA